MPAIRDQATTYSAAATTVTVPMCNFDPGDLLILFIINDAASTYTTPSTWTVLPGFPSVNTVQSNAYYKIAGASEADVAVTGTVSDSQCACIISIRDVDTTNPFGSPSVTSVTTHTATSRFACPSITTNRTNSLILYFASAGGSSTSAPPLGVAILEGKVSELNIIDGTGEGMGVGWAFQRAAGATPANIYVVNPAFATYGVGTVAAIQVVGPSGGSTVIPPYLVDDTSQLLDHGSGTAAFDSNTGMAATADTNFGTSITTPSGTWTVGDATVAAVADVGINSFHSLNGLTNAASAKMSGANVVLAASRYNVGTRDVLVHLRSSTPAHSQRLTPIAGNRGCWVGLRSGATTGTNYKIWQVHGADAPFAPGSVVPCMVNVANTDQIASAGTLSNSDVRNVGVWVGGLGALTSQVGVGMMWAMGTTTVAGGTSTEPIDISGIVRVAAEGKERLSSLKQGSSQMLCMQALQFGDGGTNGVYLNLDSTAIEFPGRRNVDAKTVFYNGIDNGIGLTYYAGAGDTIKHVNSVVSSTAKFHWRLHASSSASATYDFSGLTLIGAGDVQLRPVTTFSGVSFTNCLTIVQNAAALSGCAFKNSQISTCNDPAGLSGCTFVSGGTGHAIVITVAGTYTFLGNIFTGYGASDTTNAAIYNNSGGLVTLNVGGGGSTPTTRNGTSATTVVNNAKTLTLTGIKTSGPNLVTASEVRIYAHDTITELGGIESCTTGTFDFTYPYVAGTYVDIVVFHEEYAYYRIDNYLLPGADSSLPIQQILDRQYFNPTVLNFSITGSATLSNGTSTSYTAPTYAGATYTWSIPSGTASITSGQGTDTIQVTSSVDGVFSVGCSLTASNGNSGYATKEVTVSTIPVPVTITGSATASSGVGNVYNATVNAGATYTWSIPSGTASITSGQGTSQVTVTSSTIGDYTLRCVEALVGYSNGSDDQVVTVSAVQLAMKSTTLTGHIIQNSTTGGKVLTGQAVTAGDLILVLYSSDEAVATACTDNAAGGANTYNIIGTPVFNSTAKAGLTGFYAIAKATETLTVTVTSAGGLTYTCTAVILLGGTNQTLANVLDIGAYKSNASATAHSGTALTTSNANDIIISVWMQDVTTGTATATENGSGFTELAGSIDTYSAGPATSIFYKVVSASGLQTANTITYGVASPLQNLTVAFKGL